MAVDMLGDVAGLPGLVRSGVAPDHPKIADQLLPEKTADDPRFRFFSAMWSSAKTRPAGEFLRALRRRDLRRRVVRPHVEHPAETRRCIAAVDFAGWYNAHPHFGAGITRICRAPGRKSAMETSRQTDGSAHRSGTHRYRRITTLWNRYAHAGIQEAVIAGRRGPLQAAFTTLELRELADLDGVDVVIDPAELDADEGRGRGGQVSANRTSRCWWLCDREPCPGHRRMAPGS